VSDYKRIMKDLIEYDSPEFIHSESYETGQRALYKMYIHLRTVLRDKYDVKD